MRKVLQELKKLMQFPKGRTLLLGWGAAILFFGQLGILGSSVTSFNKTGFSMFILNLKLGNFYTFAIACLASDFMNFIQDYILEKNIENEIVKDIKTKISILEMVLIVFMVLLCFTSSIDLSMTFKDFIASATVFEVLLQLIFYLFSIVITLISFSLNFWDVKLKSYAQQEDESREKYKDSDHFDNDGGGIAI